MRRQLKKHYIESDIVVELLGGGLAGSISWLSIMPIDVIKSKIQANYTNEKNAIALLKSLKKDFGVRGLYTGATPVLIRGFIVNAATFCVWKRSLDYLNKVQIKEQD